MQSYFTRVSQIKDHLEAIGDMVEEAEIVMTTLNGLPRDWEAFIRGNLPNSRSYGKNVSKKKRG